jgi:hypothetical protein
MQQLVEVRTLARIGGAASFYSAIERGELVRICPGIAIPVDLWRRWDADQRFHALIHATVLRFPDASPLSHLTSAALWRLPMLSAWPGRVETLVEKTNGGRSRRGLIRHAHGVPGRVVDIDGFAVTTLARTLVDAASVLPFSGGVAMADQALRLAANGKSWLVGQVTREELLAESSQPRPPRGRERARRVALFADGRSGSPGESASRTIIAALGFDAPELQHEFRDGDGLIGYTDFYWENAGLIGEFDGLTKYMNPAFVKGRTPSEVVIQEKLREDRLRALGPGVTRWTWDDLRAPQRLAVQLERAGLTRRRRFSATRD